MRKLRGWNLGRLIFEEEQQGKARAEYAEYIHPGSRSVDSESGRGYGKSSLKDFRQFSGRKRWSNWIHAV